MKRIDIRILIGALLIGAGVLFLLQTFNIIPDAWDILWTAAFAVGGGIFFYVYFSIVGFKFSLLNTNINYVS